MNTNKVGDLLRAIEWWRQGKGPQATIAEILGIQPLVWHAWAETNGLINADGSCQTGLSTEYVAVAIMFWMQLRHYQSCPAHATPKK